MNWLEEYSEEFDKLRQNRVKTSYHKYGSARINFGEKLVEAIPTALQCIEKYKATGNTEYLLDAGNYIMFEYMYPQQEGAYFRATSSSESAGIVGMSVNEMAGKIAPMGYPYAEVVQGVEEAIRKISPPADPSGLTKLELEPDMRELVRKHMERAGK